MSKTDAELFNGVWKEILNVMNKYSHTTSPPKVFIAIWGAIINLSLDVQKFQPEYYETFKTDVLPEIFYLLQSENPVEAINLFIENFGGKNEQD